MRAGIKYMEENCRKLYYATTARYCAMMVSQLANRNTHEIHI